jgi:hypothetical protein
MVMVYSCCSKKNNSSKCWSFNFNNVGSVNAGWCLEEYYNPPNKAGGFDKFTKDH